MISGAGQDGISTSVTYLELDSSGSSDIDALSRLGTSPKVFLLGTASDYTATGCRMQVKTRVGRAEKTHVWPGLCRLWSQFRPGGQVALLLFVLPQVSESFSL